MNSPLDNPIWHSLNSRHGHLAHSEGNARRYPSEVAPFAAINDNSPQSAKDLLELVPLADRVGLLNIQPTSWTGWEIQKSFDIAQYVWEAPPGSLEPDGHAELLTPANLPQMLELTRLVYPAYFRQGTAELGDYFGIFKEGQLCAMAGIRMAFDGHQEISAICTHPEYRGQGYASRLTKHLLHHITSQGDVPFLHTESDNGPARRIYDNLGFKLRALLPFVVAERTLLTARPERLSC